ncbi:MAG: squalene synthase HpnC [Rhodospirillales bacterium]
MTVETPSGKDAAGENFPVGSFLIKPALRRHVAVYYAFARAIDDIADSPTLPAEEKLERLDGFEQALRGRTDRAGFEKAYALAASLAETDVAVEHGTDLIAAFKQDAVKSRYHDWDDLMAYCRLSAAPVGRYLIDLHGGARASYPASDALCAALQVINHLQDCGDDYRTLDRVYLPGDWMKDADARIEELGGRRLSPGLRRVVERCLAGCRELLSTARPLPHAVGNRRLALESAVVIAIADGLIAKLAAEDPLTNRVRLSRGEMALRGMTALLRLPFGSRG